MNMKNIILKKCAAAALAGGTLLALTACAALPVLTPAPTATVPASIAAAPTETPTASPVSANIASVLPEPTPEVEAGQEELIALLDDIEANLPIGVAGSSLKAVPFALKLIDWAQNTPLDDDGVKGAVLSWLLNKGHDEQAAFSEQFALAYSAYRTLTSGNETEAADLLDSAGCTDRDASLLPAESLPRAETLKNIIGE